MKASDLCKALHAMILEKGDVDVTIIDPMVKADKGNYGWTGSFGVIHQLDNQGAPLCTLIPHPEMLVVPASQAPGMTTYLP